jgi:Na+/H+ antiporter NhaA
LGPKRFDLFPPGWLDVARFDSSGIHATITGVVLGLLTPARRWVNEMNYHRHRIQSVSREKSGSNWWIVEISVLRLELSET